MKPVILFDGVCNFCNGIVNFLIRQDKHNAFLFAPLQSAAGQNLLTRYGIDWKATDSFVIIENGKAYQKSTAALRVYNRLPWYWKWTQFFWIIPKFIRDNIYSFIAKNRYKWFGKKEQCMMPTEATRAKFLQ